MRSVISPSWSSYAVAPASVYSEPICRLTMASPIKVISGCFISGSGSLIVPLAAASAFASPLFSNTVKLKLPAVSSVASWNEDRVISPIVTPVSLNPIKPFIVWSSQVRTPSSLLAVSFCTLYAAPSIILLASFTACSLTMLTLSFATAK
ncbi:hypothetical protein D3C71_1310860 [compost metagenome]